MMSCTDHAIDQYTQVSMIDFAHEALMMGMRLYQGVHLNRITDAAGPLSTWGNETAMDQLITADFITMETSTADRPRPSVVKHYFEITETPFAGLKSCACGRYNLSVLNIDLPDFQQSCVGAVLIKGNNPLKPETLGLVQGCDHFMRAVIIERAG